jgi:hypothetical protein
VKHGSFFFFLNRVISFRLLLSLHVFCSDFQPRVHVFMLHSFVQENAAVDISATPGVFLEIKKKGEEATTSVGFYCVHCSGFAGSIAGRYEQQTRTCTYIYLYINRERCKTTEGVRFVVVAALSHSRRTLQQPIQLKKGTEVLLSSVPHHACSACKMKKKKANQKCLPADVCGCSGIRFAFFFFC